MIQDFEQRHLSCASYFVDNILVEQWVNKYIKPLYAHGERKCRVPLQKGCPKHHGHKGDPEVTPGTCGAGGEKAQVILVRVGTLTLGTPPTHED